MYINPIRKLILLLAFLTPLGAVAQTGAFNGFCVQGGTQAATSGLISVNFLNGIIPSCTVTVYLTGTTTLATIYKDASNTPQTNPYQTGFNGQVLFYAGLSQGYDIVYNGGVYPNVYATPFTLTDVFTGGGGGGGSPFPPSFSVQAANSTNTGFVSDQYITINTVSHFLGAADLGGSLYASNPFYDTNGHNGIANAQAANTVVIADPSYGTTEQPTPNSFVGLQGFEFQDFRAGNKVDFFNDPGLNTGQNWFGNSFNPADQTSCQFSTPRAPVNGTAAAECYWVNNQSNIPGWSFGSGIFPGGWTTTGTLPINSTVYGSGIDESLVVNQVKGGGGDNIAVYIYANGEGGYISGSDQGTATLAMNDVEMANTYSGTCTSGCTPSSQSIVTTPVLAGSTALQGTGRYMIDSTQGPISTTITAVSSSFGNSLVTVAASSLPVSNAWGTLATTINTPVNINPPFTTSETFNVNIVGGTAFDTTHLVCANGNFHEQAIPTAVGTPSGGVQSITIPWRKAHGAGTYIFQGGMCGNGLEITQDTHQPQYVPLRYQFDVFGSVANNQIVVGNFALGGSGGLSFPSGNPTGYFNASSLSNSGTTVTGNFSSYGSPALVDPWFYYLDTYLIANAANSAFNGLCTNVAWNTALTTFTCTLPTITGTQTSATGKVSLNTGAVNIRPIAEVTDVRNMNTLSPTYLQVNGSFSLEPNNIQFATNDSAEEEHHIAGAFNIIQAINSVQNPYAANNSVGWVCAGAGCTGGNSSEASTAQLVMGNAQPDSYYVGGGGSVTPLNGINLYGNYSVGWLMDHGPSPAGSLIQVFHSAAQDANPAYSDNVISLQAGSQSGGLSFKPYNGAGSLSFSGPGTLSASSWTINGQATFTNGIAGPLTPSSASGGTAALAAINTDTASSYVSTFYCPNVVSANVCATIFGHDIGNNNSIAQIWNQVSNGSTSNYTAWRFAGSSTPLLQITATGAVNTEHNTLDDGSGNATFGTVKATPAIAGIAVLSSGTVTVSTSSACTPSATCVYKLTRCIANASTAVGVPSVGTVVPGTSFVINAESSTATVVTGDLSSVCWQIN